MKNLSKLLALVLILCTVLTALASCTPTTPPEGSGGEWIDYAATLKLDMSSDTLKLEATVKSFIDGDTTHFWVDQTKCESAADGILKARYLAINTPESTGKIEPWGKAASKFTRSKLEGAVSIILESDDNKWNIDSTGERHLVWVWYKTSADGEYRNLNLEILQEGYAIASNASQNRYGTLCTTAISQALANKKFVYSKDKDPDFPYGDATVLTLKELRHNVADYDVKRVSFNAIITKNDGGSVLVQDKEADAETGLVYGMTVYFQTSGLGYGETLLVAGNELRFTGVVSYWETGDQYQITDLKFDAFDDDNIKYIKLLSENNPIEFREIDISTFKSKVKVDNNDVSTEYDWANLALHTSVSMKNLKVKSMYTTKDGDSKGAISITCEVDGQTVVVRTNVMRDANNELITEEYFAGKTMDVKGYVDCFNGEYQIQIYSPDSVTFH